MGVLTTTAKVNAKLDQCLAKLNVKKEALGNILLMLSLCDENVLKTAKNLIDAWDIKGQAEMEKMKL